MRLDDIIIRWMKILSLVNLQNTGKPKLLAKRLGVSVRTLNRDIDLINKLIDSNLFESVNAPIVFDKIKDTYKFRDRKFNQRWDKSGDENGYP
ncbi:hypothetical protein C900_00296 [Fulvivirga imtechensis AK7]|uniref:Helix-turn-helix type 11 domain-containing protein n=1 Tax=Fulvivirga imtechensis AK7 TaxID=1237149 RepID=L8JIA3_9BACT|nr:HTH domain-containing protein [Fulvivirga imtechensis]ELR68555.1 hypothetical protein C900_00296 [Fulvivirga imtechensis AK7]